jgi:5-hydroxyisourate hydrolase-like protein (transthyretin family)
MCVLLTTVVVPLRLSAEGRIQGRVLNGTLNRPIANQTVRLLTPRQGMQQLAEASTDADGRFAFSGADIDTDSFYLLQTEFQGVDYPAPVQFDASGASTTNLTVYESTQTEPSLGVESLRVLAGAEGSKVRVQEEYVIQNSSQPPRSYRNSEETFRFRIPAGISEPTVAVRGLMNMPLTQSPEPGKSPGEFSIAYPLKPGDTTIIVAYEADYSAGHVALVSAADYPIEHAELHVFPSSLTVDSKIFQPAGVDPANRVQSFQAANLPRWATLDARLSGEAAPSSGSEAGGSEGEVRVVPSSMTSLGAPALFCFFLVLLWALGVRVAREWPEWKKRQQTSPEQKELEAKVEGLLNSLADLDEIFAAEKLAEKSYWKERLELKARLVAVLKKNPSLLEAYATRRVPR